jgi:multiple sugar transport system permease protein
MTRLRIRVSDRLSTLCICCFVILMALFALMPVAWLISTSLKNDGQIFSYPPILIPQPVTIIQFARAIRHHEVLRNLANSAIIGCFSTLISVVAGGLAAYSVSRMKVVLAAQMIPGIAVVIPLFLTFKTVSMLDRYLPLVLVHATYNLPFSIWFLRSFFDEIPVEIDEAGFIDGCTAFGVFSKLILPLSAPGLVATSVFCLVKSWNEFLFAVILTYTSRSQTIPVAISAFISDKGISWGPMSAAGLLAVLPPVVFCMATQRYLVRGLTSGAIK